MSKDVRLFIVTREENEYDQYGEYFEGVFSSREKALESVDHLGRVNFENTWYNLTEYTLDSPILGFDYS